MSLLSYVILLLGFLNVVIGEDCVINNEPEYRAWEIQLKQDLERNNDLFDPPSENTTFTVKFVMIYFNFDSIKEVFSVQDWMFMSWQDDRLKWDPEKYFSINEIEINNIVMWTPSFKLCNSADEYEFYSEFGYVECNLKSTGYIYCVSKMDHNAWCSADLTNWPYDKQECTLELSSRTLKSVDFDISFNSARDIFIKGSNYGAEWFISNYKQEENHTSGIQVKMTFVLVREAAGLAAIIIYPAVILSVLSITSLFLDARLNVRLGVLCFSLLWHHYFLKELAANMPKENAFLPTIVLYYRGSVIVTLLIFVFTFFVSAICKLKSEPQNYIKSVNDFVYKSYGVYLVFPRWDSEDGKEFSEEWTKFANVINCVFVFIILITYMSLYGSLMPFFIKH